MTLNMNPPRQNEHFYGNSEVLFGYTFTGAGDEPAPAPDAPARGEPLLNDFELDSSHQFFDRFQNDHFADDAKLFDVLGSFQQEPAPNFHGVASSLGPPVAQDSSHNRTLSFGNFENNLNMRLDQASLTSPHHDQFSAPNALQFASEDYGSLDTERPLHSRHYSDAFGDQTTFEQPPSTISRSRFSRQSAPALGHRGLNFGEHSFTDTTTLHSPEQRGPQMSGGPTSGTHTIAPALGFGSDHDFRNQNYAAPLPNLEDLKSAEENIEAHMRILEQHQKSAETTAPSSPILTKSKRRLSDNADGGDPQVARKSQVSNGTHPPVGDKRQRKVKLEEDGEDDDEEVEVSNKSAPRKGKQGSKARAGSSSTASQPGRRKSQVGEKPQRQNLTEEEKKQNHIRSEQKRRNQIKDGFTNLIDLMPNDVPAGTSKCAILSQAVDWLQDMIEGNEKLRAQLQGMGDG